MTVSLALLGLTCYSAAFSAESPWLVNPASMPAIGTVDKRFQSYNVEMLEVTGGRFWKPYKDSESGSAKKAPPDLYQYRPPIDLGQARLRKLAAALGPAYLRVSGTWANTTWFQTADGPVPTTAPAGFNGVLTRAQWKGVVDFAHAANAEIITSFAISAGTRNAEGVWTPEQARAFLSWTKSIGGRIAAAEFMNEPTFADRGGAPKGYDAAAYARDVAVFRPFLKQTAPDVLFLGPGSVLEGGSLPIPVNSSLGSETLSKATGPVYDIFSYHLYAAISKRCAGGSPAAGTSASAALSDEWLSRPDATHAFYAGLRDRFEPGKPLWLTETADAGCGGNPWASTFLDTFRYLDSHARLAQQGVRVIAHNTLAASDYGLLDENTLSPRPNYWAALLWSKLMGTTVLKPSPSPAQGLHLYAQLSEGCAGRCGASRDQHGSKRSEDDHSPGPLRAVYHDGFKPGRHPRGTERKGTEAGRRRLNSTTRGCADAFRTDHPGASQCHFPGHSRRAQPWLPLTLYAHLYSRTGGSRLLPLTLHPILARAHSTSDA